MNSLPHIATTLQPSRKFRDVGLRTHGERQGMDYGRNFIDTIS